MKKISFLIKIAVFAGIVILCLKLVTDITMLKKYYGNDLPNTATYENFYELPNDSIDALFLGSSHGVSSFIPQVLYDEYGIKSYNLSCSQQSLLVSFYWLKEALKTQHPKVVILDTYMLYTYSMEDELNVPETAIRQAIDPMKMSVNKLRAIKAICSIDKNQSIESYLFPIWRYHSRWSELEANDLNPVNISSIALDGFAAGFNRRQDIADRIVNEECEDKAYILDNMRKYLDEIVRLCNSNDIELILVKTPAVYETDDRYIATKEYSENNGIKFIEMNSKVVLNEMDFRFSEDMASGGYLNIWGAEKVSKYIGKYICNVLGDFSGELNVHWENSRVYYEEEYRNATLVDTTNEIDYLNILKNPNYVVFLTINGSIYHQMQDLFMVKLLEQYPYLDWEDIEFGESAFAIIDSEDIKQNRCLGQSVTCDGLIKDSITDYHIESYGVITMKESCSVMINGAEHSKNASGLNMVVYDKLMNKVVDSVNYDGEFNR